VGSRKPGAEKEITAAIYVGKTRVVSPTLCPKNPLAVWWREL
jgi:hypothetical protein